MQQSHDTNRTYHSCIVVEAEVSLGPEVTLGIFAVFFMFSVHLLHEGLVRGLGEPALLIQQRQDAHGLTEGGEERGRRGESE